jgi:thioredoxin
MRIFKYVLLLAAVMLSINCSTSKQEKEAVGKTGKTEAEGTIEADLRSDAVVDKSFDEGTGEVVVLKKADFLTKVCNYEAKADTFIYEGSKACIIDFYADWCGPCKKVEPILKELAKEYKGKVSFYKINVDEERELASLFGIRSIPTYLIIDADGKPNMSVGAQPRESFVEIIEEYLLKKNEL